MFQHYKVLYTIVFFKICLDPTKDSWWWIVVLNVLYTTHFDTVRVYLATLIQGYGHSYHSTQFIEDEVPPYFGGNLQGDLLAAAYEETSGGSLRRVLWRQLGGTTIQYLHIGGTTIQYLHLPDSTSTFYKLLLASLLNYFSNRPLHCLTKLSFALAFAAWSMYGLVECSQRTGSINRSFSAMDTV